MVKDLITDTMKKNLIITFITAFLLCLISCGEVLEDVSFGVTPDSGNVYEAGKEVYFNFSGNPDYITFYSGEAGHKYEYAGKIDGEGTANYGIPVKAMNARADNYLFTKPQGNTTPYSSPGTPRSKAKAKSSHD